VLLFSLYKRFFCLFLSLSFLHCTVRVYTLMMKLFKTFEQQQQLTYSAVAMTFSDMTFPILDHRVPPLSTVVPVTVLTV